MSHTSIDLASEEFLVRRPNRKNRVAPLQVIADHVQDGEGIAYDDATGHLFVVSSPDGQVFEAILCESESNEVPGVVNARVGASSDDAEEASNGTMNLNSSDLEFVRW